jgi:hypothetical protein
VEGEEEEEKSFEAKCALKCSLVFFVKRERARATNGSQLLSSPVFNLPAIQIPTSLDTRQMWNEINSDNHFYHSIN